MNCIINNCFALLVSRHTIVCRVAQETRGARQTRVYFTGVKKTPFSCIFSSTLPEQSFLCEFPQGMAPPIPNLSWIRQAFQEICAFKVRFIFSYFSSYSSSFCNTFWNRYNSCVLWWIALKFGAQLEHNWFLKFLSAIFCHTYMLNCQCELVENRFAAWSNIGEVPFGG